MNANRPNVMPDLTHPIIGSAIAVHRELGPGLLEGTYQACFLRQLAADGLVARHEVPIPILYKGFPVEEIGYRADVIVGDKVLVEVKAVETLLPVHQAQVLSYLKHSGLRVGLLINFNVEQLIKGVRRFVR
jgi:GxxExxY protein